MPSLPRIDSAWCLHANHWCEHRGVRALFALVSRLGDGAAWYALMAAMVVFDGRDGLARRRASRGDRHASPWGCMRC